MDGPGYSCARSALDEVTATITRFAHEIGVKNMAVQHGAGNAAQVNSGAAAVAAVGAGSAAAPSAAIAPQSSHGPVQSRNQALAQLREVADYFRRTEPHSPVAYLAEKAADWGELPLHDWLKSVIKDGASLAHVEELLGMAPKETGGP